VSGGGLFRQLELDEGPAQVLSPVGDPEVGIALEVVRQEAQAQFEGQQSGRAGNQFQVIRAQHGPGRCHVALEHRTRQIQIEGHRTQVLGLLARRVATGSQAVPQVVVQQAGLYGVQVDHGHCLARPTVQEDVVDLGIAVDDPRHQASGLEGILEHGGPVTVGLHEGEAPGGIRIIGAGWRLRQHGIEAGEIAGCDMKAGQRIGQFRNRQISHQSMEGSEAAPDFARDDSIGDKVDGHRPRDEALGTPPRAILAAHVVRALPGREDMRQFPAGETSRHVRGEALAQVAEQRPDVGRDAFRRAKDTRVQALQQKGGRGFGLGFDEVGTVDVAGPERTATQVGPCRMEGGRHAGGLGQFGIRDDSLVVGSLRCSHARGYRGTRRPRKHPRPVRWMGQGRQDDARAVAWRMAVINPLLTPLRLGDLALGNRVVMAPLTRCRAGAGRVPTQLMRDYYIQRASAGLILSEATAVSPMGVGYPDTPGIWSDEQVVGWQAITRAVHDAGGLIVCQLWHVGRISHPWYLGGAQPVAPSAVAAAGHVRLPHGKEPYPEPRALDLDELPAIIAAYGEGAERARAAGFDGVEIHAANGYLLDQFLQDRSNRRTDAYGGTVGNRARLLLEVTDACIGVWGPGRVGVHLAPRGDAHDMGDSDPRGIFGHVAKELGRRRIAFLCAREHAGPDRLGPWLREQFGGPFIANEGFGPEEAAQDMQAGRSDAIAFGKAFIANPDLPERIRRGAPLNPADSRTFYGGGAEGYTDYPFLT